MKFHITSYIAFFNCDRTVCRAIIIGVIVSPQFIKIYLAEETNLNCALETNDILCFLELFVSVDN